MNCSNYSYMWAYWFALCKTKNLSHKPYFKQSAISDKIWDKVYNLYIIYK